MNQKLPSSSPIFLGSRGSPLALWQANFVSNQLTNLGYSVEIKTWKTTGDIVQDRFLHEIGGKGLFIKELEEAMLNGDAHIAVHSLKDMPVHLPEKFQLASVLKRHQSSDVIIFKKSIWKQFGMSECHLMTPEILKSFGPLTIATSSLRRQALLKGSCPDIRTVSVRGNVDTRLKKLETESWHGIILAEASLERLNIKDVLAIRLDPNWFIPCAGQGALAIETLAKSEMAEIVSKLQCNLTRQAVDIERSILGRLGGDCTMPFGCLVAVDPRNDDQILARAVVLDENGHSAKAVRSISKTVPDLKKTLVNLILEELKANGANEILKNLGIQVRI